MDEHQLLSALRSLPTPDAAAARARASELVVAAHAARRPSGRRRPRLRGTVTASLAAAAVTFAAVQGPAVASWVRDAWRASVGAASGPPAAFTRLPGGGRILVSTGGDAWIVGQGLRRPVGHTTGAVSWSAFGNYVACACGRSLDAVALNGRVVWTERYAGPVATPAWSPDGNRIAFTVGRELYVSAGDGTGARGLRPLGADAVPALAAWRPGPGHELAVVAAAGRVSLINTDTARELRRVPIGPHALSLGWSGDGQRLLVATGHRLRVFNADGRLITAEQVPPGTTITAAEISPSGRQLAYVTSQSDGRQQALLRPVADGVRGRVLLVGAALGDLAFSPGGDWLLVGWHQLGSWMFFTTGPGRTRVRQITDVPARLGHSEPIVASWCCAPSPPAADR